MQVILAKTAGFCYGVERAVRMAEAAAREGGCVMLGSIIHNDRVIASLEALGARQADSPEQVRPGETVIIRAHGETREALQLLEERGVRIVDATCPHVLRIHRLVERAAREGRTPIIIGEAHHPQRGAGKRGRAGRLGGGGPSAAGHGFAGYRTDDLYSFDMERVRKFFKKTVYKRRNI